MVRKALFWLERPEFSLKAMAPDGKTVFVFSIFCFFLIFFKFFPNSGWEHFQALQGKARIREKRPKRALEELGGPP